MPNKGLATSHSKLAKNRMQLLNDIAGISKDVKKTHSQNIGKLKGKSKRKSKVRIGLATFEV